MRSLLSMSLVICSALFLAHCSKRDCCAPIPDNKSKLSYGESVFYLANSAYSISPLHEKKGTYTAFPGNLQIDRATGRITVDLKGTDGESQTGMWYRVTFSADNCGGGSDTAYVLISGITYIDRFYRLSQNDSILHPIYNGDPQNAIPSGNYDIAHDNKFAINPANGQINLKECMRRGFFSSGGSASSSWKMASIKYAVNDKSNSVVNQIDIVLYYYHSMNDVPANVSALMQAHQQMTVGLRALPTIPSTTGAVDNNIPGSLSLAKPRPPCVIIVGN